MRILYTVSSVFLPVLALAFSTARTSAAPAPAVPAAQWVTNGPYGGEVISLAGNDAGILYAGTGQGAFVSRDGGQTWTLRSSGLAGAAVEGLAIDKSGDAYAATSSGLFRKGADSLAWKQVGPPDFYLSVTTDPSGGVYAGAYHSGVVLSLDHGATWLVRPPAQPSPAVYKILVDGAGNLYAGTQSGVYVSRDTGASWDQHDLHEVVSALGLGPQGAQGAGGPVFAGTSHGQVYVSHDAGQTWVSVTPDGLSSPVTGLLARDDGSVVAGNQEGLWVLSPGNTAWSRDPDGFAGGSVNTLLPQKAGLYAASTSGVLEDTAHTWALRNQGLWAQSIKALTTGPAGLALAATRDGLYRSSDSGSTWAFAGLAQYQVEALVIAPDGTAYAAVLSGSHPSGVIRSTDKGQTWTATGPGLPANNVYALAVDSTGTVFAATQVGFFRTADAGQTWTESDAGMGAQSLRSIAVLKDGTLFTCSRDGIFRSQDHGAHWTAVNNGLDVPHAEFLAAGPDGSVYASSGASIFRTADQGEQWTLQSRAPGGVGPVQLAVSADHRVFASDLQTGVWVSSDQGAHWAPLSAGLYSDYVQSLSLSPDGKLLAGTNGASIWQLQVAPAPEAVAARS